MDELKEKVREIMIDTQCGECIEGLSSSECEYCRYSENGRVFKDTLERLKGE